MPKHRDFPTSPPVEPLSLFWIGFTGSISLLVSVTTRQPHLHPTALLSLGILGASYLAVFVVMLLSPPLARQIWDTASNRLDLRQDALPVLLGGLGLCMAGSLSAGTGHQVALDASQPLWALGVVLVYLSLRGQDPTPERTSVGILPLAILFSLMLGGAALRLVGLERMPYVLSGDEGSFGLIGWEFVEGARDNLLGLGWFSFPALYSWLLSLSQAVLGRTTLAIRLVSAVAGTLTIGGTYLAGKRLFNQEVGFIAAAWLATFHYHIFFSRIAYNNIFDGLFLILCIACLYHGWVHNRRDDFLNLGVLLGFSQYFYTTSRAIPLILIVWLPWLHRRHAKLAARVPQLLATLLMAGAVSLPLIADYAFNPASLTFTAGRVSLLDPELIGPAAEALGMTPLGLILEQTLVTGLGITVSELQGIYLDAGQPMVFGLSALLLAIGLFITLLRWKQPRTAILLITLLLSIVIGGVSIQAPSSQRLILLPPILSLLIAFPLYTVHNWLKARFPGLRRIALTLLVFALGWMSFENIQQLFMRYYPEESYGSLNGEVAYEMTALLEAESPALNIFFIGGERMQFDSIPSISYLRPGYSASSITDPDDFQFPHTILERTIFIILPEQSPSLNQIRSTYPEAAFNARYNRHGRLLFYLSILDPGH